MSRGPKIVASQWGIDSLMQDAFRNVPERVLMPRNYIYASELGYDFASRFLLMSGHKPSNVPNERSLGKMFMGQMIEALLKMILVVGGVFRKEQVEGKLQLKGMLLVSGKGDLLAGGSDIDWDKAEHEVKHLLQFFEPIISSMPPVIKYAMTHAFPHFKRMFTTMIPEKYLFEVKSVSSFVMDQIDSTQKPRHHHWLQYGHYKLSDKERIDAAHIYYLCRDDARRCEFRFDMSKEFKKAYTSDVATMTDYYNAAIGKNYLKHIPPLAPEVIFEEGSCRFNVNMNVSYSRYLTFLYNYKSYDEYRERWGKTISSWNATFRRHVLEGQPTGKLLKPLRLTPANIEIIAEAKKLFPQWDKYVHLAKKAGAFQKPEENEDE